MKLGKLIDQTTVRHIRGGGFLPTSKNAEKTVRFYDSSSDTGFEIKDVKWTDHHVFLIGEPARAWRPKRRKRKKTAAIKIKVKNPSSRYVALDTLQRSKVLAEGRSVEAVVKRAEKMGKSFIMMYIPKRSCL